MQTERMYAALQGLGKRAKMVLLPYERHAYDALESVLHVVAEQDEFLYKFVHNYSSSSDSERTKRAKI